MGQVLYLRDDVLVDVSITESQTRARVMWLVVESEFMVVHDELMVGVYD